MAVGFPTKANWAAGDVLTAAQMDDLAGTVNLLNPAAKGDLFTGSAANTYTKTSVGTNNQVLTADSTAAGGVKWANPSTGNTNPAFKAYRSGTQTITASTYTKIQLNAESFDTNNCFDSTTNYRFTPTTSGYYQINATIQTNSSGGRLIGMLYFNGTETTRFSYYPVSGALNVSGSDIYYFNGTTDYLELWTYMSGTTIAGGVGTTTMSGTWVRN